MAILQVNRERVDIVRDGLLRLNENVGINATNSSATGRNLLEIAADELSSTWATMNTIIRRGFITTAAGEDLDRIGELLQESRKTVKRALDLSTTNFYFYLDKVYASSIGDLLRRYYTTGDLQQLYDQGLSDSATNPTQIILPSSITITSEDGAANYTTINDITLSNTQDTDYTPIIASTAGTSSNVTSNVLINHNLVQLYPILGKIADAIKCTNHNPIRSGADVENDDNYRFRLANKVVSAVSGNDSAIRGAVLSVPGVVDMSLVKRSHGNGTFTIFPRTVDPVVSQGVANAVRESVSFIKSEGDVPYVDLPTYLAVVIRVDMRFGQSANKDGIFADARLSIMDYINNLPEGGEIVINEIVQRVMGIDDKIIDMNVSEFGFGEYDTITGAIDGYTPLRLVNQIADWDQRWYTNTTFCNICETGSF